MTVDLVGDRRRRVAEVPAQPRERPRILDRDLRERVPERVERPLLARRADPRDLRALHRRVEHPAWHVGRQVAALRRAREDERAIRGTTKLTPPRAEHLDDVSGDVDVPSLVALRCSPLAIGVRPPDADHRVGEVDVGPRERGGARRAASRS